MSIIKSGKKKLDRKSGCVLIEGDGRRMDMLEDESTFRAYR